MTERIKVGDLVMVVRGHTCTINAVGGLPFTVEAIFGSIGAWWQCSRCKSRSVAPPSRYVHRWGACIPLPWLKRIPPLAVLDEREVRAIRSRSLAGPCVPARLVQKSRRSVAV